jgi:hypothetical protein
MSKPIFSGTNMIHAPAAILRAFLCSDQATMAVIILSHRTSSLPYTYIDLMGGYFIPLRFGAF